MSEAEVQSTVPTDTVSTDIAEESRQNEYEKELERLFQDRFTELDENYMATVNKDLPHPPCVENWYSRPKRNFDWARGGRGGGRGGGYRGQGHQRDHYQGRHYNRGNYQGHRQGHWNNQGPHRDQGRDYNRDNSRVFYPKVKTDQETHRHYGNRQHPYGNTRDYTQSNRYESHGNHR